MTESPGIQPLSAYLNAPFDELIRVFEHVAAEETDRGHLDAMGGLVVHRTLRLLREGARDEILKEGLALDRFLYSQAGDAVKAAQPDIYWAWVGLSALLGEAARRSDRAAVDSILRSQGGHGRAVLELLAERGGPVRRGEVRDRLGLSESHLSHVLRDLDEADLIERTQVGREVALDLGPVGREVVERAVLPEWVRHLADVLRRGRVEREPPPTAGALEKELSEHGAPSRLVARQLAEAVSGAAAVTPAAEENARRLIVESSDPQIQVSRSAKILLFTPGRRDAA